MSDAILTAGTTFGWESDAAGAPDTFDLVDGILTFGAVGVIAEAKEDTTLADTVKTYSLGMTDTAEQTITGQLYADSQAQRDFIEAARSKLKVKVQVSWTGGTSAEFELQLLGFVVDESSGEDWQTFTINARQSGDVTWTDPAIV